MYGITTWPKHKATPKYWCLTLIRSFFIAVYPTMMLYSIILCRILHSQSKIPINPMICNHYPHIIPNQKLMSFINPIKNPISILLSPILSPYYPQRRRLSFMSQLRHGERVNMDDARRPVPVDRSIPGPGRRELRCIQKRRAEINIETYRNSNKTCKKSRDSIWFHSTMSSKIKTYALGKQASKTRDSTSNEE